MQSIGSHNPVSVQLGAGSDTHEDRAGLPARSRCVLSAVSAVTSTKMVGVSFPLTAVGYGGHG